MSLRKIDDVFYKKAGATINEKRRKKGYSLRYLAELTGISRQTLDLFELGKIRVTYENFDKICKALNLKPNINIEVTIGEQ